MAYYLGMDAGGSKTYAVVSDSGGRIVGVGRSGCGNHQTGRERAEASIREATAAALTDAGLSTSDIAFAYFGLAGADREADFRILRPIVGALGFTRWEIACDTMIALRAGTRQADGVVIICGTGVNCAGVNRVGDSWQCGGFGYQYGDYGGGSGLATEVYRAVVRQWEGRAEPTLLTELTLAHLGFASVEDMFHDFLDRDARIPLDLTKLLFQAGEAGDPVATSLLHAQGRELGMSARAVIRKLGMGEDSFDIVLAGSLLTRGESPIIEEEILKSAREAAAGCRLAKLRSEPVVGAVLCAMDRGEPAISEETYFCLSKVKAL